MHIIDIFENGFTLWKYNSLYFGLVYTHNVHKNNIQSEKKEKYKKQKILVVFLLCFYWVIETKLQN